MEPNTGIDITVFFAGLDTETRNSTHGMWFVEPTCFQFSYYNLRRRYCRATYGRWSDPVRTCCCLWSTEHFLQKSRYSCSWFEGIHQSNFTVSEVVRRSRNCTSQLNVALKRLILLLCVQKVLVSNTLSETG